MNRALKGLAVAGFFGLLLVPIGNAFVEDAEAGRAKAIFREMARAEREIPVRGDRRIISYREQGSLEMVHRVYCKPAEDRRVVFVDFRRDGKSVGASSWWGRFYRGSRPSRKPPRDADVFHRLVRMAGWSLPSGGRRFFSSTPQRFRDLDLLVRNYRVDVAREGRVAGRDVDVVRVVPRHAGRPSYEISLDVRTRYPLKYRVTGTDGRALFESSFDDIQYRPAFPEGVFGPERKHWHGKGSPHAKLERIETSLGEAARSHVGFKVWQPRTLPAGFRQESCVVLRMPGRFEALHTGYTDGACVVLLVEYSAEGERWKELKKLLKGAGEPSEHAGKHVVHSLSRRTGSALVVNLEGTVVTVTGNLEKNELLNMVRSLRRVQ